MPKKNSNVDVSNDLKVAEYILKENDLFFCNQFFYEYTGTYWSITDERNVKRIILDVLKDKYKQTAVRNILDIIQVKSYVDDIDINLNESKGLVNCLNGFFNIHTGKHIPHSEETKSFFSTNQFQVNYSPGAKYSRWIQFLDEIFSGDPDKNEKKLLLQEMMGLCLTRETKFEKAFFLLGNGSNGKSLVLTILETILGRSNLSSLEFDQIGKQFLTYQLIGKLVNLCTDIDSKNKTSYGAFKRIVTGETMLADIKRKAPVNFKPHCKLIFAANKLPQTTDTSKGYFRRIMIVGFNQSFEGSRKDKDLRNKLIAEIDGVFLWMIDGLNRLLRNQKFTVPVSSEDEMEKYLENSNSVVAFVNERCEIKIQNDYYETYESLFSAYKKFCEESGLHHFKKTELKQEISDRQYKGRVLFVRHGLPKGNHFQNIKINSP